MCKTCENRRESGSLSASFKWVRADTLRGLWHVETSCGGAGRRFSSGPAKWSPPSLERRKL